MLRSPLVLVCVALVLLVPVTAVAAPGGTHDPHTRPFYELDEASLPFGALPGHDDADRQWGTIGGAGYRLEVPADWNGDLVVYAHGYAGEGRELSVTNPSIRGHLLDEGYAWAASSYAANGYAVAQGVRDTMTLTRRFNSLVARPDRVYLMGHSMGGHVTGVAIEQHPDAFDGALPMCGVMGDRELFDFFLDHNLVAQALAGVDAYPAPDGYTDAQLTAIREALWTSFPAVPNARGLALAGVTEQRSGGDRPLFGIAFGAWAAFLQTLNGDGSINGLLNGEVAGNAGVVYQADDDPALSDIEQLINDRVERVEADRHLRAPRGLTEVPVITGDLPVPVLTLHGLGDLFVPFSMEQIYAREAAEQGHADRLVQRAIRDVDHCGFTRREQTTAFDDLVRWVEDGVRPAGDDVLDEATVAAPTYGCRFTLTQRPYDPVSCG